MFTIDLRENNPEIIPDPSVKYLKNDILTRIMYGSFPHRIHILIVSRKIKIVAMTYDLNVTNSTIMYVYV